MTATITTTVPIRTTTTGAVDDQLVVFHGIGWTGYAKSLEIQGDRSRPQMVYLDGDVLLMSPSYVHERFANRFGLFVTNVVEELDIPCEPTRETTFRREKDDAGVQPDESFYLANHAPIAAKDMDARSDIDLRVDPPPDLVIEVVNTHPATEAVEVLRRLGVPEVWVCQVDGLRILVRQANGRYAESPASASFPFLSAAEIFIWASRPGMASMTQWLKESRRWVRETLVPRVQGPPNN